MKKKTILKKNTMAGSQSNENTSFTLLHISYIFCAFELLLIFCMSSNDVAISPESLSTYLTITGKHLPFSLLVVYVANPYQRVNNSSSFRSPVTWFAIAPGSISVVFMRLHRFLFTILKYRKTSLKSLVVWFTWFKGSLSSTRKPEISSSAFTTF